MAAAMVFLAATAAPPAIAQNSNVGQPSRMVTVSFCNKTADKIYMAVMYRERAGSPDWIVEGWKVIQGNNCFDITVPNTDMVYNYAEDDAGGTWEGDFKLCVEHPGPFHRVNSGDFTCDADDLVGFKGVDVVGLTSKTVNFNP